ncbi:MAG: kynureninase [Acidobacterium sp.]|nr:kynureninase [Acidobacteriota bacterium]PHY11753.1 MAG: kynureninase [Acidobacterium sp.]
MITRRDCLARDSADPLASLRAQFAMAGADAEGVIYLDGNSLGALPAATGDRIKAVVESEWGVGLIRSWNSAGWIDLGQRIADKIATLIGAAPGEVVVADSTSVNLYKVLSAALAIQKTRPARAAVVSERTNFPTDLYIADTLARAHGLELVLAETDEIPALLDERVAVLMLTHVNYRTGRMHRMADITEAAHAAGAVVVWDLAHSAGALPVDLNGADADFAVGCGYKYLNGGPGAPAFAWAHARHLAWMDQQQWRQPLAGWLGHAAPFAFTPDYRPGAGMARFICGTPPMLSLAALECGVDTLLAAEPFGGIAAIRDKSIALTELFIALVESHCAGHELTLVTPRAAGARGSQASFAHATGGYQVMQALIARGVIGDFRAPDILRFGFTPLYTRFVDVWDAVAQLEEVMTSGEWREPRFNIRAAVT